MPSKTISTIKRIFVSACELATVVVNVTAAIIKDSIYPQAYLKVPIQAGVKGTVLETQFRALTTKHYTFYLDLHFPEGDRQARERVRKLSGTGQYNKSGPGARQIDTGLPIPIRLSVGRADDPDSEWSIINDVFIHHDLESYSANSYRKIIAGALFARGTYRVRVEALQDIPELSDIPVTFVMHGPGILHY